MSDYLVKEASVVNTSEEVSENVIETDLEPIEE
jgi:hypothetical protein